MNPGARKGPIWTPTEDAVVIEHAPTREAREIAAMLPGRTVASVFHRMARLVLQKRRRWTEADDTTLEAIWGGASLATVAAKIGRTQVATYWRVQKLGLGLGCPTGMEYLTTAAKRCGYGAGQLRMILHWARVNVRQSITRRGRSREFIVDPLVVDEAVKRWHATETPHAASRRLGFGSGDAVVARLVESGLALPRKPSSKAHWRIPSETIDRAVAMVVRQGKHIVVRKETA